MKYWDKPLASKPFTSYRYSGRFGYIMVGAMDDEDALLQANRSLTTENAELSKLEVWNGSKYVQVKKENTTKSPHGQPEGI